MNMVGGRMDGKWVGGGPDGWTGRWVDGRLADGWVAGLMGG